MKYLISPLRMARLKKGFSQQGISILTDIPQVNISYAERGYLEALTPVQWQKLADTLEARLEEIQQKIEIEGDRK